jgi:hypothetical protein
MGAADDMRRALGHVTKDWTKQRKVEEKNSSMVRWRSARLAKKRDMFATEAAEKVMEECYMKASGDGEYPANVRRIFYVARPLIEDMTRKPLDYNYFSQTLLPNYLTKHGLEDRWDVVYDDRGHFREPHTEREVGLGTINVRNYLSNMHSFELTGAELGSAGVLTYGPCGCYGAVLYIEKEGFMPLFERMKLVERHDIAIMSSKGMSVTAARMLAEHVCCRYGIPLLGLHDFDRAGIIIADTLANDTRRYSYGARPRVIDLGLTNGDINGLLSEPAGNSGISDERLRRAGLTEEAIAFLAEERVELNAMTSPEFVDFVERKLEEDKISKVIPSDETIKRAYRMFIDGKALREEFEKIREDRKVEEIEVPEDIVERVREVLEGNEELARCGAVDRRRAGVRDRARQTRQGTRAGS